MKKTGGPNFVNRKIIRDYTGLSQEDLAAATGGESKDLEGVQPYESDSVVNKNRKGYQGRRVKQAGMSLPAEITESTKSPEPPIGAATILDDISQFLSRFFKR